MQKSHAIQLLGGTSTAAAAAIGASRQAVDKWPDVLPPRIADRVQAALWRIANREPHPVPQRKARETSEDAATQ